MKKVLTGVWGGRADSRGLAAQTQGFAKWLQPSRVMGIDMTVDKLSPYECEWSPYLDDGADLTVLANSEISEDHFRHWAKGLDVILGAETFYKDEVILWARDMGIRTIIQCNPEFASWMQPKGKSDPLPDILINPTTWRMDHLPANTYHLPFPVDRSVFPFRLRTHAEHFVHVAGHRAMADRAGTQLVFGALNRNHPGRATVRSQTKLTHLRTRSKNAEVQDWSLGSPADLYADADVILLPRRYGGQSLALNEALSSGCPVITLNREPESTWPGVMVISSRTKAQMKTKGGLIPVHDGQPQHLVTAMTQLSDDPAKVEELSHAANAYASTISWDTLLPVYESFLRCVVDGGDPDRVLRDAAAFCGTYTPDVQRTT